MTIQYGTVEYFAELFSDILASVDVETDPESADKILKGFYQSLNDWLDYHEKQVEAYRSMKQKLTTALSNE